MSALRLIIEHGIRPRSPAADHEVWRDPAGTARGYVYSRESRDCVLLPGLAVFEFERAGGHVTAFPEAPPRPERIEEAFYRCVLPMALQARGCEALHASAVQTPSGAVVGFPGLARTGKSTLAVGLTRRGYPLWANDALVLDVSEAPVRALPVPFSVRLRPDSEAFFGGRGRSQQWIDHRRSEPVPLAALCVLKRSRERHDAVVHVRRLSPKTAFLALLTHACCFTTEEVERKRRTMANYLSLVTRVPVFEISFVAGFQHFAEVLDGVEEVLGAERPRPALAVLSGGLAAAMTMG